MERRRATRTTLIGADPIRIYDVSVQGGGTRNTYFISGGYLDQEGSIQPN